MARDDLYIGRQVFFECSKLRGLAGRLATDDGTDLGCFERELENVLLEGDQWPSVDTYTVRTVRRLCRWHRLLHCTGCNR
jgi:hypothetical protein